MGVRGDFPLPPMFHAIGCDNQVELLQCGEFNHLNRTHHIGFENPDWLSRDLVESGLWKITLHYHGWAWRMAAAANAGNQDAARLLRHYVLNWIDQCDIAKLGSGNLIWNAFAVSTRLSWWIRTLEELNEEQTAEIGDLPEIMIASMYRQADHLSRHVEWDLRANHVLRDACGLAWAGRYLSGPEADKWLAQATEIAVDQVAEQVLADGGHFERTPMYHLHVMEDVLSLAMLLDNPSAQKQMRDAWQAMAEYLDGVLDPNRNIPLFNDGAHHAVCDPQDMLDLGERIGVTSWPPRQACRHFAETGTITWHGDPWTVFFDVGPVGPDEQPGHTHADSLTLDCTFNRQRLFVDPGTYDYCTTERRAYDRSTAAHNTITIDETNSSEVWGIFRVGDRAYPQDVTFTHDDDRGEFSAAHDGYKKLPGQPIHQRTIQVVNAGELTIIDQVRGSGQHKLSGGFLLDPSWNAEVCASGWQLTSAGDVLNVNAVFPPDATLEVVQRPLHDQYGHEETTQRIQWAWTGTLPFEISFSVQPVY